MLKIALAQMEVICGKPETNIIAMKKYIEDAKAKNVDLIVFPELCVGGYLLADRYLDDDYCRYVSSFNESIKELSNGIGIVWGNIRYESIDGIEKGRDGRAIRLNCVFFASNGEWVKHEQSSLYEGYYIKHLNPDYRMFEDSRYFVSALELDHYPSFRLEESHRPFVFQGHIIGLEACEDLWSKDYGVNMTEYYGKYGADYVINVSSSPWTKNKEKARRKHIKQHINEHHIPYFVYVNQVGYANNGKNVFVFDGGSCVMSKEGIVAANDQFAPELLVVDSTADFSQSKKEHFVTGNETTKIHRTTQETNKESLTKKLLAALIYAIQQFDSQLFQAKVPWIIGLSGGLDSSISAALLTMALGAQRIKAYNMRTYFNSSKTIDNAQQMANVLGFELRNGQVSEVVLATKEIAIDQFGYNQEALGGLVNENIQARVRGHMLSTFAAIHGGVVCNNGNKVEVALGYCTLYGDSIGALSILGDLLKVELFDMAHEINAQYGREVIPVSLLPVVENNQIIWDLAPSAELRSDQTDPMKWFYHDALIDYLTSFPTYGIESFLGRYLDGSLLGDETFGGWMKFYGLDDPASFIEDLEWVLRSLNKAIFKRIQMPPIITVSRGAFGNDLRESQLNLEETARYRLLKQQILEMKIAQ